MTMNPINLSNKVSIPYEDRFRGTVLLGPPSSRKREEVMLPMIQQDIEGERGAGVAIFDSDGTLTGPAIRMALKAGRHCILLDPTKDNCPFFNPLMGDEDIVITDTVSAFGEMLADLPPYIRMVNETALSNAIKILKRLDAEEGVDGKHATLANANVILQNFGQKGQEMVNRFACLQKGSYAEKKENTDIASWFINEYYAERSKVYENAACVRGQVAKMVTSRYLRGVLNPDFEKNERNNLDFESLLRGRVVLCVSTAKKALGDIARWFGAMILLKYQRAVFYLDADDSEHPDHLLYVDELQDFVLPEMVDLFVWGYQARVAPTVSFQSWPQIDRGGREYKQLRIVLLSNLRNTVLFPGLSKNDASYYAEEFSIMDGNAQNEVARELLSLPAGHFAHWLLKDGKRKARGIDRTGFAS